MLEERLAESVGRPGVAAREGRGLVPPDGQYQLSADDCPQRPPDAGHDFALLSGLVSDALHRPALVHGLNVFDFEFLSRIAKRALPKNLASDISLLTAINGTRHRAYCHQYQGD